jgi:lysyl-tRNA synthetase class 2
MASEDELIAARRRHAEALRDAGAHPYPNDFRPDEARRKRVVALAHDEQARAALPGEDTLPPDAERFPLYGRVMAKRGPFLVIQTPYGNAQALVRPEALPPEEAAQYKVVDLADHVAVEGPLLKTKTGALCVKATSYRNLGKALLPPPEKWHGLHDVETRYRERYVDLFANPTVAEVFRARSTILGALRSFLDAREFVEVESPLLHPLLSGATARPFRTPHNTLDIPLFLRVAPELYLKRLLVGGFDRVYELGRCFRNEGVSARHNPEFTMLELYMAYGTVHDLIVLTEQLLCAVDAQLTARFPAFADGRVVQLRAPFARATMRQCVVMAAEREVQVDGPAKPLASRLSEKVVQDPDALAHAVEQALPDLRADARKMLSNARSYGDRINAAFELLADAPRLSELFRTADGTHSLPLFVTEHPVETSPLARRNELDPRFVDRFELYMEDREVCNGFSELNDPDDQAERFQSQVDNRERGDEEAMDYDHDYVRALRHGMPPTAGLGVGVDRLVMTLCRQPSIRDVLLFPLLRPEPT